MLLAGSASAAIGIDVTTSTDRSSSSTTIASSALSTASSNELLLAFISADYISGASTTVTAISGGSLTWVLVVRTNGQSGTAEIWRAFAPTALSNVTVTATLSRSLAASMTIMSFTGVNTSGTNGSGAIGATASANASSGAPMATLVTKQNNSWVFGVGDDWDNGISRTIGPSQTLVHQYLATVGDTYWVQRQTNATPLAGTSVTINDTAPAGDRYNLSIVEVVAAAAAGPTITATAGTSQSATVLTAFLPPLQVLVKDASNNPVNGALVTFTAPSQTGASGTFAGGNTATTNSSGVASAAFTANSVAGSYFVTASVAGASTPASFSLTNTAGSPSSIVATAGTTQSAPINAAFGTALQATVKDGSSNLVSGVVVTFTAPSQTGASGTFAGGVNTATTINGVATAPAFTANGTAGGPYTVTASYPGATTSASFTLTNNPLAPANITASAGSGQSVTISMAFGTLLKATVTDASSHPVSGVTVTFTAPSQTGASGTFAGGANTATTDSTGVATAAAFTANTVAGSYTVTAKVTGVTATANFNLTNNPGPPASITATAGASQNATINTAFTTNLQATVKDASTNLVSGVTVTFTAPGSGASGTFAGGVNTATTINGVATAPAFTANGTAGGPYTVTASYPGATTPAGFSLTNNAISVTQTLFPTQTPATANNSDGSSVNYELGTAFTSDIAGQITAVRFWKASKESGTHTGHIWSGTGTLLATVTFANETASGWQQQALTTPLSITANTRYVVSVSTANSYYVSTDGGLASQVNSGDLHSVVGNNGVYGATGMFPTNSWESSNYFRDVVFNPGTVTPTYTISGTVGIAGATVTLSGASSGSTTSGSGGAYSFTGLANGMYTITPSLSGYTFNPGSQNETVSGGGITFNFTASAAPPNISSLSPASGLAGTSVTIAGTGFGMAVGTVTFNGAAASVTSWSGSSIMVTVPAGATSGYVVVTAGGVNSNGVEFTVSSLQLPTQAQVVAAIETVNNYWLSNNPVPGNANWDQATYLTGDLAAYDATGQANYLTFAQTWATNNSYSLCGSACGEGPGGNTTTFPDYQAAGQPYIRLYQLSNNSSDLTGITGSISGMVNSTVDNEWTWVDAINMSMPDFADLGSINNNTNYYTKMYALYSYAKYSLGLYDSTTGLWWRDSTFVNTTTYWSRGNGWAFADHAKVLSVLPTSDPHYAEYLSTFTAMAQALAARQQPGGYWDSGLGATDPGPESSGTALFLYGLAWGLNNGILDQNTYLPVVEKAWNYFTSTAIQPSGLLGYVQNSPACNCPGPTSATSTFNYGVGAFLLAGRQMQLLTQ